MKSDSFAGEYTTQKRVPVLSLPVWLFLGGLSHDRPRPPALGEISMNGLNFSPENFPQPVKDVLLWRVNHEKHEYKDNEIHPSELSYCLRKAFFERKCRRPKSLQSAWYITRGVIIGDFLTSCFPVHEVNTPRHRIGDNVFLKGRCDAIYQDKIWEFKVVSDRVPAGLKPEHAAQAGFYDYTLEMYGSVVEYVSMMGAANFEVEDDYMDLTKDRALELYGALVKGDHCVLPLGPKWQCPNCEYKDLC